MPLMELPDEEDDRRGRYQRKAALVAVATPSDPGEAALAISAG